MAIDSSGNLYVASEGYDGNGTVERVPRGPPRPAPSSPAHRTGCLAFDSSGNLYVANLGQLYGQQVRPGSTTASATLHGCVWPSAMAFDASGNLYVTNDDVARVSMFAPGATTASATSHRARGARRVSFRLRRQPLCCQRGQWHGQQIRAGQHYRQHYPHRTEYSGPRWRSIPAATYMWPTYMLRQ